MVTRLLAVMLAMHPLHTTMTQLTVNATTHSVRVQTGMFADDFQRASRGETAAAYVARRIVIVDGGKHSVALRDCGTKRTGELLWICTEGQFGGDATALSIADAMLCDLFDDQVNIVQIMAGAERRSLLFVKGDRAKPLR